MIHRSLHYFDYPIDVQNNLETSRMKASNLIIPAE